MDDIIFYGHLVIDEIHDGELITTEEGGITNCANALQELDVSTTIIPTHLGFAKINIDRANRSRSSVAELNREVLRFFPGECDIAHVLYLNELSGVNLDYLETIKQKCNIITADLCKGKEVDYNLLDSIDYIFVSDDEHDVEKIVLSTKNVVIAHSPNSSFVYKNHKLIFNYVVSDLLENVNVLGAGDIFAASFLYKLHNNAPIRECIDFAHKHTFEMIKKYNEKI